MSHFYRLSDKKTVFCEDITTPAQARRADGFIVASVTTKLEVFPKPFLIEWGNRRVYSLTREYPDLSYEEVSNLKWKVRESPSGEVMSSSDFGTFVHDHLKMSCNAYARGQTHHDSDFQKYTKPFIAWLEDNSARVIHAEHVIGSSADRTAGMVDLIIEIDGAVALMDYKTREGNGKLSSKSYHTDLMQLAIEAEIIKYNWSLGYSPSVYSVIIDVDTGKNHVKKWNPASQLKAYNDFCACSDFYDVINGLVE